MPRLPALIVVSGMVASCNAYGPPPAATVAAADGQRRTCFYASNVSGYRLGANDTVIVNTNARDYYELTTQQYCARRLDFENRMALRSRGGNFICSGIDAEIYVPDSLGSTYCPVYSVRKLAPAEVATVKAQKSR